MSYRPSLHPPQGKWGVFLDQMRVERDWSAVEAWENLHDLFGLKVKSTAVYKNIEQGHRAIKPVEAARLVEYFGREPEEAPELEPVQNDVVVALNRQSLALETLADRIGQMLESRSADMTTLAETLATLLSNPGTLPGGSRKRGAVSGSNHPGQ